MQRKTLTERLTNKYQLIVRNEENFADRWTFSFNFAKLLVALTILVLLFYGLVTGLNALGVYLIGSDDSEETQQLVMLAAKVDSIEYELEAKDNFIIGFKNMLEGGETRRQDTAVQSIGKGLVESKISKEEEEFRKKFEKEVADPSYRSINGLTLLYFFAPIEGKNTAIMKDEDIVGLSIEVAKDKPVKSLDAGIVVLVAQNVDSTYKLILQHKNGLLTIYDHVKTPLVKVGANVDKMSNIGSAAAQRVTFIMIFNGKILNPRQYIAWNK